MRETRGSCFTVWFADCAGELCICPESEKQREKWQQQWSCLNEKASGSQEELQFTNWALQTFSCTPWPLLLGGDRSCAWVWPGWGWACRTPSCTHGQKHLQVNNLQLTMFVIVKTVNLLSWWSSHGWNLFDQVMLCRSIIFNWVCKEKERSPCKIFELLVESIWSTRVTIDSLSTLDGP